MSTTDKTRDKLLASMRKSKAGAGSKQATASRPAARKKTTTPRRTTAQPASGNKAAALAAATMDAETRQPSTDAYQSSGRVWPD